MIVLDAGDEFQGSLFFTTYGGQVEAEMMNRIGFDAMVFGNHEFDLGPEPLAKFIETAEFPVLSGSVDVSGDNMLAGLAEDHLVLEIGGEKVAIVGATTPDTPEIASPGPTVTFRDPVAYLTAQVAALAGARASTRSSCSATSGVPTTSRSPRRCRASTLIVGGHSHTLFSNTAEGAPYPYPLMGDRAGRARRCRSCRRAPTRSISAISTLDLRRRGQGDRRGRATPSCSTPASRRTRASSPASRSSRGRSRS